MTYIYFLCFCIFDSVVSEKIGVPAMLLSFFGGLLVYGTILGYAHFFVEQRDVF